MKIQYEEQPERTGGQIEIPKIAPERQMEEKGKTMKELFFTLLILTIGLLALVFVGDWMSTKLPPVVGIDEFKQILRSTGMTIVYAMGGLTALFFAAWLIAKSQK